MNKWVQCLVVVGAVIATYLYVDNKWEAKWQSHLAQDERDRLAYEQKQRDLTDRYNQDREAFQLDMQARMADLGAAVVDSGKHADSLQQQLDLTRSALQRSSNAAKLAGVNQGAAEAALVLSDLYSAAIQELQRVAGTADQWYEQLDGCNRFYQQVKAR